MSDNVVISFIYLFIGVLHCFQNWTGHIMMGSFMVRGNQYIQLVKVLYCKLLMNGKQLPAFPLEVGPGTEPQSQRWEARVLPLCQSGQCCSVKHCPSTYGHYLNFTTLLPFKRIMPCNLLWALQTINTCGDNDALSRNMFSCFVCHGFFLFYVNF